MVVFDQEPLIIVARLFQLTKVVTLVLSFPFENCFNEHKRPASQGPLERLNSNCAKHAGLIGCDYHSIAARKSRRNGKDRFVELHFLVLLKLNQI
ncbi:hypothetical protein T02_8059 [Trichinella nativa]|uniref:Uncharacterized protein n=2 Tax=Trichinella TaxID=6333 RepID=A0A0V1L170_9BILA|nr:hypothetical protein T06_15654 [Trichinella sp. T6]KRY21917.1 hypothetical protein T12_7262 [Trichinella patagoniensis]KRZ53013.1 hypothetical protein T02_8059 [Trichinella nativa]